MDFPPVINLISATFNELNYKEPAKASQAPPQAVQPVANAVSIGGENEKLGANSAAVSGTNRVGTVIDTVA